ncbi:DUF6493 family protein [Micromonospora peucetia]|uniref:DUF6493 family protein n=1 Tax=Micromonospora peucetia TaxID=47871 RepID=A0A1C6W1T4_9ACTN|nr:DUF6493 family protein [Micromonospora peucetia]WSA31996.1 DUF6493 family protein [Micromonospora peucetia]SCL72535.1 hypothetical protein GA0070608_5053 [Micromonospora peucetia]
MSRAQQTLLMKSTLRRRRELAAGGTSDLLDLVQSGLANQVAAALAELPEQRRREIGGDLTTWFKQRQQATWWTAGSSTALAAAVVGCLPTAAQAATILTRNTINPYGERAATLVSQVAEERGITWLGDLAHRLAAKANQQTWVERWRFLAALLRVTETAPPTNDRFVELWLNSVEQPDRRANQSTPLIERLRADPFLTAMLPRLFEVDGLGSRMMFDEVTTTGDERQRHVLPTALARLATEGSIDRKTLIDGAIGRLLRGDRAVALRAFTILLTELEPTTAEVATRATDYLRLLTDAPAPTATMAQKALRQLPDLEIDAVLDTSRDVLLRPDKTLVKAQLSWLDRLARQHRDRATQIAEVIAVAAEHPAVELRDRANTLATRHGHDPTATGTGRAFARPRADDLPPPAPPAPAPTPITDVDELAEEVAALLGTQSQGAPLDRILDGLVRLTTTDSTRVHTALTPVIERRHWSWGNEHRYDPLCLCEVVVDVLTTAAATDQQARRRSRWEALLAAVRRTDRTTPQPELIATNPRMPAPHRLLRARLLEIGAHANEPGHPGLLATPTSANGLLDPLTLLERLAALGDRTPWHWDLTQALLRLPADTDEAVAGKATALGTPAGERLATWLRTGGLPQPVMRATTVTRRSRKGSYDWEHDQLPPRRILVELRPPDGHDDRYGLLTADPAPLGGDEHSGWAHLWPSILPGHRGVIAAYTLPIVAATADMDQRDGTAVLPLLAESSGPGGVALDLALAYGLGARHGADRVATLDALLGLAGAGQLDATGTGEQLGRLIAGQLVKLTRALEPLRDAALAGAPLTVWRLTAAALPAILATPTPPRGLPDLLSLAAETASTTGTRIEVPGLDELAARGGTSRLGTEARRLRHALDTA